MTMKYKRQMLQRYDQFVVRMFQEYSAARAALDEGNYVAAHAILARIGLSHAKTSMSLRNVLVKDGLLKED